MLKLRKELDSQPKPVSGLPPCPRHLKGRTRNVWEFLRTELEVMDLDCRPDALALEGAVTAYVLASEADQLIARQGIEIEQPVYHRGVQVGTVRKANPTLRARNAAWGKFLAFVTHFGLSPQARQSLAMARPDGPSDAEVEELLSGPTFTDAEKAEIMRSYEKKPPQ